MRKKRKKENRTEKSCRIQIKKKINEKACEGMEKRKTDRE